MENNFVLHASNKKMKKNILKEYHKKIGKKGGSATFKKHGKKWMSKIAKMRWKKARDLSTVK